MSEIFPERQDEIVGNQFFPLTGTPPDEDAALARFEDDTTLFADLGTLEVTDEEVPPFIGKSWAFDFLAGRFVAPTGANGPVATHGVATLTTWIEKAIRNDRGSQAIHPPDYGMPDPYRLIGHNLVDLDVSGYENDLIDTLTFHPRIADVTDFTFDVDPDALACSITFTVVLDDESTLSVESLTLP